MTCEVEGIASLPAVARNDTRGSGLFFGEIFKQKRVGGNPERHRGDDESVSLIGGNPRNENLDERGEIEKREKLPRLPAREEERKEHERKDENVERERPRVERADDRIHRIVFALNEPGIREKPSGDEVVEVGVERGAFVVFQKGELLRGVPVADDGVCLAPVHVVVGVRVRPRDEVIPQGDAANLGEDGRPRAVPRKRELNPDGNEREEDESPCAEFSGIQPREEEIEQEKDELNLISGFEDGEQREEKEDFIRLLFPFFDEEVDENGKEEDVEGFRQPVEGHRDGRGVNPKQRAAQQHEPNLSRQSVDCEGDEFKRDEPRGKLQQPEENFRPRGENGAQKSGKEGVEPGTRINVGFFGVAEEPVAGGAVLTSVIRPPHIFFDSRQPRMAASDEGLSRRPREVVGRSEDAEDEEGNEFFVHGLGVYPRCMECVLEARNLNTTVTKGLKGF